MISGHWDFAPDSGLHLSVPATRSFTMHTKTGFYTIRMVNLFPAGMVVIRSIPLLLKPVNI